MSAATDPDLDFEFDLWDELREHIALATTTDERSLQVEIGPSGMGTPCVRKLAHRLANTPPASTGDIPWRPQVGRTVHTWLEGVLARLNDVELATKHSNRGRCEAPWCDGASKEEPFGVHLVDGWPKAPGAVHTEYGWHLLRYMTEWEVAVGTINGRTINGHIDVYDRMLKIIVDWKIMGPKSLKDHHAHGMGEEYRVQGHVYGRGVTRTAKLPVERIALCCLPMNGELRDGYVLSEPYDPTIANEAFRRARIIEAAYAEAAALDGEAKTFELRRFFKRLKTAPDYCPRCPWFAPGATDYESACPGDTSMYDDANGEREFEGLI